MPLEDVMPTVMGWSTATAALAALGARLALAQAESQAPPEIDAALRGVLEAGGVAAVDYLPPPQQAMLLGVVRMFLHHALELVDQPGRASSWTFTDPVILDGWGRGSTIVPALIASAHPDLRELESFLDVGTGVGLLAVAAAGVWPNARIVGIDTWEPALERARTNVTEAGLGDRITLRPEDLAALDDEDAYDCVWLPTFFLSEAALEEGVPAAVRALRPGGWVVLGRMRPSPDPLTEATAALRTTRSGGYNLDAGRAAHLLEHAGCRDVHTPPEMRGAAAMEFVLGRRSGP
jgi:SAM-dependent methyltransferase